MNGIKFLAIFSILFWIVGCGEARHVTYQPSFMPPSSFKKAELNFSNVYSDVLRPSCISCHSSNSKFDLTSYGRVKELISKIYKVTIVEREMPRSPISALSPRQLGLLNAWIVAGAPNSAPIPPLEATFESIQWHIIEPKCIACHSKGRSVERIPLETLEDFLNSPLDIVIPGNAAESGLILTALDERPDKVMPPLVDAKGRATGFSRLTDFEIAVMTEWINSGAK